MERAAAFISPWASMVKQLPSYMLVVEDSDEDFGALQRILTKNCDRQIPMTRCLDGDDALDFLYGRGTYNPSDAESDDPSNAGPKHPPSLIMLDLNLPGTDGREVLSELKQDPTLKMIPVVVFTTSSNPKDVETCYRYGVNSYLIKPMNVGQLKTSLCVLMTYWFEVAVLPTVFS